MKKLLLMLAAVMAMLMLSCKSMQPTPRVFTQKCYYMDYSNYTRSGFFITESMSCPVDYESVGSMSVVEKSGYMKIEYNGESPKKKRKLSLRSDDHDDEIYGTGKKEEANLEKIKVGKEYRIADPESALEYFVSEARKAGANGVLGLRIERNLEYLSTGGTIKNGWCVSGMLIKK